MDQRFERYFKKEVNRFSNDPRFNKRRFRDNELRNISLEDDGLTQFDIIQKAILDFEENHQNIVVRDDTKLLLFINFNEMVYKPLSLSMNKRALNFIIYDDIISVLTTAYNDLELSDRRINRDRNERRELSSHKILVAGARIWDNLKSLSSDSW